MFNLIVCLSLINNNSLFLNVLSVNSDYSAMESCFVVDSNYSQCVIFFQL